jgi:putative flippase GtrA
MVAVMTERTTPIDAHTSGETTEETLFDALDDTSRGGRFGIEWPAWVFSGEAWITLLLVSFATLFVIWNLRIGLWFDDTTPTGGDMGAHVWSPEYLRGVLLPNWRLTGWSPDWYAGFPAFTFYMVVPSLLIVILNVGLAGGPLVFVPAAGLLAWAAITVRERWADTTGKVLSVYVTAVVLWLLLLPVQYGIAMKLVVVAGMVTLPAAAYLAGRLGGLAFPGPGLLAVFTLPFLFDHSYNIYGGNLLSTMAGEFAYSLGLTVAVVYIGVAARGLETGRHKGVAAALLALTGLLHLFAAFFALVATVALFIIRPSTRTLVWTTVMGITSALLAAFWVLPFFANRALLNDMGWGKERRYVAALWDRGGNFGDQTFLVNSPPLQLLIVLAVIGLVLSGARRVRLGMALGFVAVVFAGAFLLLPEGRLWNVRLLPFYYLSINLLAGIGVAEMGRLLVGLVRNSGDTARAFVTAAPALVATLAIWVHLGLPLHSLPYGSTDTSNGYSWTFWSTDDLHLGPYWLAHNFRGYEGTAAAAEYEQLITTMARVGEEYGCGRSLWEYQSERLGSYGTPMAPMLLPHWTDGCIGSMEGLYFEASATTPYHFLMQSELSQSPSRAQRDLPYSPLNVAQGVGHLQDMGVRYYLAFTDEAIVQAQSDLRLTEIATSGPWVIFLVNDADLVVGLDRLPVVVDGAQGGGEEWLVPTVAAWEAGDVPLIAESGPPGWPRISTDEIEASIPAFAETIETNGGRVAEIFTLSAGLKDVLPSQTTESVEVSDIETDEFTISFRVDQIGSPVLVRTSYFPNWTVSGADGPYRVAPNLMVVVPTQTEIELNYGRSGVELFAMALTLLGLVGLAVVRRVPDVRDVVAWDLSSSPTDRLPSVDTLGVETAASDSGESGVDAAIELTDLSVRQQTVRVAVATALVAATVLAHVNVRPTTVEPLLAIMIWLPGVVGAFALVTTLIPGLVRLHVYRATIVRAACRQSDGRSHFRPAELIVARLFVGDSADRPDPRRFALVGLSATAIDFGLAVALTSSGVSRLVANTVALVLAAAVSLLLHGKVTLRGDAVDRWIRQPPVFVTVAILAGAIDMAIFLGVGGPAGAAKFLAIIAAALVRSVFHRLVLFRAVRREQSLPRARPPAPGNLRFSVVVPAFNEEERIAETIATIRDDLAELHDAGDLEIVVVDDGSFDSTANAARAAGADHVVVQSSNGGKGAAVRAGVLASSGRTVAFTDADLAYAPHQLAAFLDAIESGYDVAIGNRHHGDAETLVGTSRLRSFGSRVINMATNLLLLGNYRDTQCGCKAFRSDAARVVMATGTVDGFAFDIEVLHLVERYGLTMTELPVEVVNSETSTVSAFRDGIGVLYDIVRVRWAARRGSYPVLGDDVLPVTDERSIV